MAAPEKILDATAMVGLYGELDEFDWANDGLADRDMFSVFVSRASAMGWSSNGPGGLGSDLWGMNDASQDFSGGSKRLCWLQVGLTQNGKGDVPLPLVPLIAGAWDSLSRFGLASVTGVQVLAPIHIAAPAAGYLASGGQWFTTADPARGVHVTITLDTGSDDAAVRYCSAIQVEADRSRTDFFRLSHRAEPADDAASLEPPLVSELWMGEGRHVVSFESRLPEWAPESVSWLVMTLVECCRAAGVATSVLIGVTLR